VGRTRRSWRRIGRRRRRRDRAGLPAGSAEDGRRARRLGGCVQEHAGREFEPTAANGREARHDLKSAGADPCENISPGRRETFGVGLEDVNPRGANGLGQPVLGTHAQILEHDIIQPEWNEYDIEFEHDWWADTAHGSPGRVEHSPTAPASDPLAVETRRLES
jgi:hypothetical protein